MHAVDGISELTAVVSVEPFPTLSLTDGDAHTVITALKILQSQRVHMRRINKVVWVAISRELMAALPEMVIPPKEDMMAQFGKLIESDVEETAQIRDLTYCGGDADSRHAIRRQYR